MLAIERRNLILEKLQDNKKVVVSELSKLYHVSEETIRRDLEKLEQDGYATKSYGGAVLNENVGFDMPLTVRSRKNVVAKQKNTEIAAGIIHDGDHIMLDASSTDLFIAKAIKEQAETDRGHKFHRDHSGAVRGSRVDDYFNGRNTQGRLSCPDRAGSREVRERLLCG